MLIRYFNAEIQIVSLVNFTLLSQRSFVPSLASVTKSAVVGHFLSLREPTITELRNLVPTYIYLSKYHCKYPTMKCSSTTDRHLKTIFNNEAFENQFIISLTYCKIKLVHCSID